MFFDELHIDVAVRNDSKALLFIFSPVLIREGISLLTFEVLDPWSKRVSEQVKNTENNLAVSVGVGRVNVAFYDIVVHQAVNDIGRFPLSGADDG